MRCFACTRCRLSTSRRAVPTPGPARSEHPRGCRSRWVSACGLMDQVVEYFKPVRHPKWMSEDEYKALPESIMVRELRYRIIGQGSGREVTLVTTLLDAKAYPADELAELYGTRWRVEEDLKSLKQTMKMDVLKCMTVDGVLKELTMYALAYNLVRGYVRGSGPSGGDGGTDQLRGRATVAAWGRGGRGDAGVGGQPVASWPVRAPGEEAAAQAVSAHEEAEGRISRALEGEGLGRIGTIHDATYRRFDFDGTGRGVLCAKYTEHNDKIISGGRRRGARGCIVIM